MAQVKRSRTGRVAVLAVVGVLACNSPAPDRETQGGGAAAPAAGAVEPSDALLLAAARVALPPPGIHPEDLPDPSARGATLMARYCVACHQLPSPLTHSATDWPSVVRRMWLRMERVDPAFHVPVPNDAERFAMLDYLLANSLRVSGATLPEGTGRETFSVTCSQCHELPDPNQHTGSDWVSVVRRMATHMEDLLGVTMTADTMGEITNYLRTVSGS